MMNDTKAQVEVTFNWIYVLIAGAVILMFFVGIIVKQKAASEERLSVDLLRVMESIFTGAGVSEKTKNFIDTSGLAEYTLYFNCEEDGERSLGVYGITGQSGRVENIIDPLFAPVHLKTSQLIVWSLPYAMPYKAIDFLFVTSSNTQYYILGTSDFVTELLNATEGFNRELLLINSYMAVDGGKNYQVRFVDVRGNVIKQNEFVPEKLQSWDDDRITAVAFVLGGVIFFQKEGKTWQKLNQDPLPFVSLGGERDATRYAAIFSGNPEMYQCNMKKAFRRLRYINEIYGGNAIAAGTPGGKLGKIVDYYNAHPELKLTKANCFGVIKEYDNNLVSALTTHQNKVLACVLLHSSCPDVILSAQKVRDLNEQLEVDCLSLY